MQLGTPTKPINPSALTAAQRRKLTTSKDDKMIQQTLDASVVIKPYEPQSKKAQQFDMQVYYQRT